MGWFFLDWAEQNDWAISTIRTNIGSVAAVADTVDNAERTPEQVAAMG